MGQPGFVYVLTNAAMPSIVKIGRAKDPISRCDELFNTSLPVPFQVHFAAYCDNASKIERMAHERLDALRVNESREFFSVNADKAKDMILRLLLERQDEVYEMANIEAKLRRLADQGSQHLGVRMSAQDVVRAIEEMPCPQFVEVMQFGMEMKALDHVTTWPKGR
jgi:hypothetical protein